MLFHYIKGSSVSPFPTLLYRFSSLLRIDKEMGYDMWRETELSAILRSIEFNDFHLPGLRKLEFMANTMDEKRLLEVSEEMFWQGNTPALEISR
jgi:hypothetical protein